METPPVPLSELRRYLYRADRRSRGTLGGTQMLRRKGQSLEFRGFAEYQPGMDTRHIDWRASLRLGEENRYLMREFEAEQSVRIVLSLDLGPTMQFPHGRSKADVARDIAWTIGAIGLLADDRVVLHSLTGEDRGPAREFRGAGAVRKLWRALEQMPEPEEVRLNLAPLEKLLPPASVWVILSDFYFDDSAPLEQLRAKIRAARDSRLVLAVDIDSWEAEKPESGEWRIEGPGREETRGVKLDNDKLKGIKQFIDDTKEKRVLSPVSSPQKRGRLVWDVRGTREAFWPQFREAAKLSNLFVR